MVQQFGKILGQGFQQAINYVNTPANKKQLVRMMQGYFVAHHTEIEHQVETGIEQIWMSITSIKITIKNREKEVEIVSNAAKNYSAIGVKDSIVIQGERINCTINFNFNGNQVQIINKLELLVQKIKEDSLRLDNASLKLEQGDDLDTIDQVKRIDNKIQQINNNVYLHGENIQKIISQITDYSQFQKALGITT
ncbi:hypothetical protein [Pseudanabaena sp. 'Roaring Creek']|uniref:hypothetical protein n=1 Tax=Pseudanabaena sp. 'Roaring Creek' TaxID=1681830 RepID=UPI0006D7D79F|nr:hypothetical protein [Pseudanabaena sp. 'Roaring Creek']